VATKPSASKKSGIGFALPSLDFLPFGKSKQASATPGLGYVGAQARPKGGMGGSKGVGLNPMALILGVIVVVLVIAIVVVLFNSSAKKAETVPSIPISGLTDTSDTTGESTAVSSEPQAPTSAKFEYSVASGGEAWIEIYENGSETATYAGVVDGPKTETYDVVGTLTFQTANVTPVTLKVDDVVVEPTSDDSGYYVYTVNFPEILAQWQKENLTTSGSSSSSSSSST
jgi:hypothetical protein